MDRLSEAFDNWLKALPEDARKRLAGDKERFLSMVKSADELEADAPSETGDTASKGEHEWLRIENLAYIGTYWKWVFQRASEPLPAMDGEDVSAPLYGRWQDGEGGEIEIAPVVEEAMGEAMIRFRLLTVRGATGASCEASGRAVGMDVGQYSFFDEASEENEEGQKSEMKLRYEHPYLIVESKGMLSFCGMRAFVDGRYVKVSDQVPKWED
jgi:hypothetical protein